MNGNSKQKHLNIKVVPKSYFEGQLKLDKRAISIRLNHLLNKLIDEQGKLNENFKLTEKEFLVSKYRTSPRIYRKGIDALAKAKEILEEKEGKTVTEMEIISQLFYDDYHKKGISC